MDSILVHLRISFLLTGKVLAGLVTFDVLSPGLGII